MNRDEAIKVIRDYYPSSGKDLNEALETLVPELKENEDEKIRKGLIAYFDDFSLPTFGGLDPKKIISWLKKQGSQNLANSAKTCKDEQNPAWSEDDENMLACCEIAIDFFKNLGKNSSGHPHPNYFDLDKKIYPERVIDWLKSIKERVLPQPKQEWSEEDKEALRVVTNIFEQHGVKLLCYPAFVHWLKTLPNRITFYPYWKPSDEQLDGIKCAIKTLQYQLNVGDKRLDSLYNDLKKLKG